MSLSSWFRRRLLRENGQFTKASIPLQQSHHEKEEQFLGVTDRLIEFVKSFTFDTFKNFPLQGISLFPSLYFFISIQKHGSAFLLSFAWILGGLFNELEHFRFVSQLRIFFFVRMKRKHLVVMRISRIGRSDMQFLCCQKSRFISCCSCRNDFKFVKIKPWCCWC